MSFSSLHRLDRVVVQLQAWHCLATSLCPAPLCVRQKCTTTVCSSAPSDLLSTGPGHSWKMLRWQGLRTFCLWAACLGLALAQDLPPITISGQSSGPAAVYTGTGAGAQDATCDSYGPRKQCGVYHACTLPADTTPHIHDIPSVNTAHTHSKLARALTRCNKTPMWSQERASTVTVSAQSLLSHRSRVY